MPNFQFFSVSSHDLMSVELNTNSRYSIALCSRSNCRCRQVLLLLLRLPPSRRRRSFALRSNSLIANFGLLEQFAVVKGRRCVESLSSPLFGRFSFVIAFCWHVADKLQRRSFDKDHDRLQKSHALAISSSHLGVSARRRCNELLAAPISRSNASLSCCNVDDDDAPAVVGSSRMSIRAGSTDSRRTGGFLGAR